MADYNVIYSTYFQDNKLLDWRVDILGKDVPASPVVPSLIGGDAPLKIERLNSDENPYEPVIKSRATFTYICDGVSPDPLTFIEIEEDSYQLAVYRQGALYWKGFVTATANSYPYIPYPFPFSITAADFSFMDATPVNLDDTALFLYDFISIGDYFNRSVLQGTGYPVELRMLYNKQPDIIGGGDILNNLYTHTDSMYSFDTGAEFVTDSLKRVLSSLGARIFFSGGCYWVQYIPEIGSNPQDVMRIATDDFVSIHETNINTTTRLSNNVTDEAIYSNLSQEILSNRALKQQTFEYNIKPINQIKNFDWRTEAQSPFTDWEGDTTGFFQRVGAGGYQDPFRLRINDYTGSGQRSIWSRIPVQITQLVELQVKIKGYLTLPAPSTINYKLYLNVAVVLVEAGEINVLKYLDSGGEWVDLVGPGSTSYFQVEVNATADSFGTLSIQSKPIPSIDGISDYEVLVQILDTGISPDAPSGSTYYTELYPIFLRVYNSPYVRIDETVNNNMKYSMVRDREQLFYIDTQDVGYSNTLFYLDGSEYKAIPVGNWQGKTIDSTVVHMRADQEARPTYSFLGTIHSNQLEFHHGVSLVDMNGKMMMQVRDSYNVKQCLHTVLLREIMPEGAANVEYTKLPLTQEQLDKVK